MIIDLPDSAYRTIYRLGFGLMRLYWRLRKPHSKGAAIALWHEDELLLVRNSYRDGLSLPGGGLHREEAPRAAAQRELWEELGVRCEAGQLGLALELDTIIDHKRDHLWIFELRREQRPPLRLDQREVIWADWFSRERALGEAIPAALRCYLER